MDVPATWPEAVPMATAIPDVERVERHHLPDYLIARLLHPSQLFSNKRVCHYAELYRPMGSTRTTELLLLSLFVFTFFQA